MSLQYSKKSKLIFVPHYIGGLRYFEKLLPYLAERYEVRFLILFVHKGTYREMLDYCRDRGLAYDLIAPPGDLKVTKFPVISFVRELLYYKKKIIDFITDEKIKKIISVNDGGIWIGYLMNEANKLGIDTAVLQWALSYQGQGDKPFKVTSRWRQFLYNLIKPIYVYFKKFVVYIIFHIYQNKVVLGGGVAKRFGVINQQAFEFFRNQGVPVKKIAVVGYLDFHLAESKKQQLETDELVCRKAAETLGLDLNKKQVVIFTSAYNSRVLSVLDDVGQYQFYEDIVKTIRQVFSTESHDILIKPHPIEQVELYKPLEKFGVKIFDRFADNFALVYFSDLYIADSSTANFIPITMGKKVILIDFFHLPLIEKSASYFGIKGFVSSREEFLFLLQRHKEGKLEYQYQAGGIVTKNSLNKILNWIG